MSGPEPAQQQAASEDSSDAIHRRFLKESPAMFKDGVTEVSRDNEIAYSEVAKVSQFLPAKVCLVSRYPNKFLRFNLTFYLGPHVKSRFVNPDPVGSGSAQK